MAYLKRTAAFQWSGKSITFDNTFTPIELDAKRAMDKYRVHDDQIHERRLVYRFQLSDVEDPEIYAAQPILEWQKSDHGQWVMTHGLDPTFHIISDYTTYCYIVNVTAHITPKRWTEYCLRFDKFVF